MWERPGGRVPGGEGRWEGPGERGEVRGQLGWDQVGRVRWEG